jgi:hypothetical protein
MREFAPKSVPAIIVDFFLINEVGTTNIVVDINGIVYFSKHHTISLGLGHLENKTSLKYKNVNVPVMLD